MTVIAVATVVTDRDYITLYVIRKDVVYRNILKRSKKNLRPSLKINLKTASRSK